MTAPTRLAALAARLRAGEVDEVQEWLDTAAAQVDRGVPPLRALGLAPAPGERKPETRAAFDRREHWLRIAAALLPADLSRTEAARRFSVALARYHDGRWQRKRADHQCPEPPGTMHEALWHILKAKDHPLKAESLRRIRSFADRFS